MTCVVIPSNLLILWLMQRVPVWGSSQRLAVCTCLSGCAVKNSNAPNRSGRASSCCLLGCLELRAAAIGPNVQFLLKRPQSEDAILQSDSMSTGHVAPWFLPDPFRSRVWPVLGYFWAHFAPFRLRVVKLLAAPA